MYDGDEGEARARVCRHIRSRPQEWSSSSWKKCERAAAPETSNISSATELNYIFAFRDRSEND